MNDAPHMPHCAPEATPKEPRRRELRVQCLRARTLAPLLFIAACGARPSTAEPLTTPGPDAAPPNVVTVNVPPAADAGAVVAQRAPAPRCTVGAWQAEMGCIATAPWTPPAHMHNTPISALEQRWGAVSTLATPEALRERLALAVTIARAQPPKEQIAWYQRALEAFDLLHASPSERSESVDLAAEASYALVTASISTTLPDEGKGKCPAATAPELFGGPPKAGGPDLGKWRELSKVTEGHANRLYRLARTYASPWSAVAEARQGLLFANQRATLDACDVPTMAPLAPKQQAMLAQLRSSNQPDLVARAAQIEHDAIEAFRQRKERELAGLDELAARHLGAGIAMLRGFGFAHPVLGEARAALIALGPPERVKSLLAKAEEPLDPEHVRRLDVIYDGLIAP